MLIKLSEILDVSLYELSICKKLDKEKLSTKVINKFKSIKDLKRYNLKKIIKITLVTILIIFSIFTAIFTFKNYGTVEIYELESLEKDYFIDGQFIFIENNIIINVNQVSKNNNNFLMNNKKTECEYSIYNNKIRLFHIPSHNNDLNNNINIYKSSNTINYKNDLLTFYIQCPNESIDFKFRLNKKYDNKLF